MKVVFLRRETLDDVHEGAFSSLKRFAKKVGHAAAGRYYQHRAKDHSRKGDRLADLWVNLDSKGYDRSANDMQRIARRHHKRAKKAQDRAHLHFRKSRNL